MRELVDAMNWCNYDESNPMIDYFNVGWYISVKIGTYNKPYVYEFSEVMA